MVQEAETPVIDLELVSCGTCDTVFISSARRQTCPACGGEAIGPYLEFVVTPEGPRLKNGAVTIAQAPAGEETPAPEPPAPAAEDAEEGVDSEERWEIPSAFTAFTASVRLFLEDAAIGEDDLAGWLERMGADPETATTTIGRLVAVRDTLASLAPAQAQPVEEEMPDDLAPPVPDPEAARD